MTLTVLGLMATQYLGVPYAWGGNDYLGFDCSGLVLKSLNDVGIMLPDMTSQGIYNWSIKQESFYNCEPTEPDCLMFYGKDTESISHVAISLGGSLLVESGGSGRQSTTMAPSELAARDARVRLKYINHRRDLVASIKVLYKEI